MILVRNMEKTSKFHNFFNFQQKSRDTFVLRRLKVNSILTSLAFCYQFFSSFRLLLFLGDFRWICWAGHNIKHFLSNSVGSAECQSMRWRPSDFNLFLLEFLQKLKQKKKSCRLLSGNFEIHSRFAQACSNKFPRSYFLP